MHLHYVWKFGHYRLAAWFRYLDFLLTIGIHVIGNLKLLSKTLLNDRVSYVEIFVPSFEEL